VKEPSVTQQINHDRNDRIEASVMVAALATLGILVALAVSTSLSAVSQSDLQAAAPSAGPETAHDRQGIETTGAAVQGSQLR